MFRKSTKNSMTTFQTVLHLFLGKKVIWKPWKSLANGKMERKKKTLDFSYNIKYVYWVF